MKILILFIITITSLFASQFYAVVQPIDTYSVKSSVSGSVIKVYSDMEAKVVKNNYIIKIDSEVDKIDLKQSQLKLNNLKAILKIEKDTLDSFNRVSSKSKFDKDNQKIKVLNISLSISDMEIKVATLSDKIDKKSVKVNNLYIAEIIVKKGDYVNPGTALYTAYDISKSKLEIFLPIENVESYSSKTIYIDDKKTDLKINRLHKVADSKHISSYKCEIILDTKHNFSKVVKVTFK
ncbi:MAG: hypothetical protein KAJ49_05155 [Arcobacteraceae bacterium]|nr:hypothetical protein [Arcobacteraceae bacterium]